MSPSERGDTFADAGVFHLIREQVAGRFTQIDGVYCFPSSLGIAYPAPLSVSRYLDRFYIVSDSTRLGSDLEPERVLFDSIASEYNSDIDRENNIKTADTLLRMTDSVRVIDLGCGTGLALQAPAAARCELVGIDASDHMVDLARDAGMDAVNLRNARSLQPGGFDGLISCYALHLHGPRLALLELIDLLDDTGRVAANFHKGIGYEEVSVSLASNGFRLIEQLRPADDIASSVAMWERA